MSIFPKINPARLYKAWSVKPELLDYPKWKHLVPAEPTEKEFMQAWRELFKCDYDDCKVEYGKQELMGNILGRGLIVNTPKDLHYCGDFQVYTDDPILGEQQCFYYPGAGCSWATDIIGQRFPLIDAKTALPRRWNEIYGWEVIKRYKPFLEGLF